MIYECRLNGIRKQHAYGALLAVSALFLLNYFDIVKTEYWSSYAIGILLALGVLYLVKNSKVRIEINDDIVTVYHSGMVHANIPRESIANVDVSGDKASTRIVVSTTDGLKYHVPLDCFRDVEIGALIKELKKA